MRLVQKISAGILITFSLLITAFAISDFTSPQATQKDKDGDLAALIIFSFPSGLLGGFLAWNVIRSEKKQKAELAARESDRLQSIFYLLLKKNKGEITPLLFAMETKLSPGDAKTYLDQKAKEFDANFDVDDHGGVTYKFSIGKNSLGE
jgi:hypothetical protein